MGIGQETEEMRGQGSRMKTDIFKVFYFVFKYVEFFRVLWCGKTLLD